MTPGRGGPPGPAADYQELWRAITRIDQQLQALRASALSQAAADLRYALAADVAALRSRPTSISDPETEAISSSIEASAHVHSAADITSGVLADARIPGLDAAKIVSGVFDAARIPNLDAAKITTGTLSKARLPSLPRCSAYHNTTQTLSDATWTALNLNSEDFDSDGMHDTAMNNTRVVLPEAGLYLLWSYVFFDASAVGQRQTRFMPNGGTVNSDELPGAVVHAGTAVNLGVPNLTLYSAAANDYIELHAFQSSGGNLDVGSAALRVVQTTLAAVRLL